MRLFLVAILTLLVAPVHADQPMGLYGRNTFYPPAVFAGLGAATAIASSTATSCAVVAGEVSCWGWMSALRPGAVDSHVPEKIAGLAGVTQLSVGLRGACALRSTGEVRCFGDAYGSA